MPPEIPPQRIRDLFTRIDELLVLNLRATQALTEAVRGLAAALGAPIPEVPAAVPEVPAAIPGLPGVAFPPVAPAPLELAPLASRIDIVGAKLDTVVTTLGDVKSAIEEYRRRDLQGRPVALSEAYSGTDQAYQAVVRWRVGDMWGLDKASIEEVSMASSDYDKTLFRLSVAGKIMFKDLQLQSALSLPVQPPNEIARGEAVKVECKSSDGTAIVVTASITGREH